MPKERRLIALVQVHAP